MSISNSFNKFLNKAAEASQHLSSIAKLLPSSGVKSFDIDESGRFKLIYDKKQEGTAAHKEKKWDEMMSGVVIKVSDVVTGKIDTKKGSVEFDKGCVIASSKLNIHLIKLVDLKDEEKTIDVSGKWKLISKSMSISLSVFLNADVSWQK